jgi:nucleoside 2-deoxyribosyltransferase
MAEDYETLKSASNNMSDFAKEVVLLVERLVTPRNVFMIMSFKRKFKAMFTSCEEVCLEFKFKAERTDESASLERIVPRIETGIQKSAFVIADLSEPSPNVFYELGFARALGKDVILTARKNTQLPFDVRDIPTILWENKNDLKNQLRECIRRLVDSSADKTV